MNLKKLSYVLLIGGAGSLSIYYLLGDLSSTQVQTTNRQTPSAEDASTGAETNTAPVNPFQKLLDEQGLNPSSTGVQQVKPMHVTGQDPFKAFLDAQNKQRLEEARRSPFEK